MDKINYLDFLMIEILLIFLNRMKEKILILIFFIARRGKIRYNKDRKDVCQ